MKNITRIISMALVIVMLAVTLVSCASKYSALEKAFVKNDYSVNKSFTDVADTIKAELEKEETAVELHLLTKSNGITSVLIVEFKATKDMVEAYKNSDTIKGLVKDIADNEDVQTVYESLENAGYAKGNCLVIPLSILYVNEITNIVKSVK